MIGTIRKQASFTVIYRLYNPCPMAVTDGIDWRKWLRICIFCTEKAATTEDAWPLWLMKRFPSSDKARTFAEIGVRNIGNWPMAKPRLPLKRVCRTCNNGWMSRLENEAKPVIESILDDKIKAVDASAQLTLARWAVKTAMVLETVGANRDWFYSETERSLMGKVQTIPQRTSVWIAKCVDHPNIYSAAKGLWASPNKTGVHAFNTTMGFGSVALQVVSIKVPAKIPANIAVTYDISDGPWDQTLVQVWPSSQNPLSWPPKYGLKDELGLEALTERLSPEKKLHGKG